MKFIAFATNSASTLLRLFTESNDTIILSKYDSIFVIPDKHTHYVADISDFALDATITNIKFCVYFYL